MVKIAIILFILAGTVQAQSMQPIKGTNVWLLYAMRVDPEIDVDRVKFLAVTQCDVNGDLREKSLEDFEVHWTYASISNWMRESLVYTSGIRQQREQECLEKYADRI